MCGHNPMLYARIGDWTWETVSDLCSTDVFQARDRNGNPAYLSFVYYRVRGGPRMNPHSMTFGDQLTVRSASFGFGKENVLTLHRIAIGDADTEADSALDLREFYETPRDDCLYVETLNRWISRSVTGSNDALISASPEGFRSDDLPTLPARYSPRGEASTARRHGTFHPEGVADHDLVVPDLTTTHTVDLARDLNGVGLLHFASYFSHVDTAVLNVWRSLGRDHHAFLNRRITDVRLCYLGNPDADQDIEVTTRLWRSQRDPRIETAEVVLREKRSSRMLAVASACLLL